MAKKEKKEKRRRSSSASSDGEGGSRRRDKVMSKFQTVDLDEVAVPVAAVQSLPPPSFTPVVVPTSVAPVAAAEPVDERVPLHLLQPSLAPSAAAATPTLGAAMNQASEAAGGLLKEPDPPLSIVRVTKDGPPPAMPLDLIDILSG